MSKLLKNTSRISRILWPYRSWIGMALTIVFITVVRVRLLQFPLERDEGEFAYIGQLMLQGIPPYSMAYNVKFPGIYAAYAIIMAIFGQSAWGIHLGLLLINIATIIVVFLLGRRLLDSATGAAAAVCYGILSLGQQILGLQAHATHFVVLPALGGLLLLLKAIESGRTRTLFWSGILLGTAYMMKQPGAFFGLFAILYLLWSKMRNRPVEWKRAGAQSGILTLGILLPFMLTCLVLWLVLVFPTFWFWTFSYAREYGTMAPLSAGLRNFWTAADSFLPSAWPLLVLSALGIIAAICDRKTRARAPFLLGLLVFSALAMSPGFYFRKHYFIMALPAISLLAGVAVGVGRRILIEKDARTLWRLIPAAVLCLAAMWPIYRQREFYFNMDPVEACRSIYQSQPFPEAEGIAKYLREHTSERDTIAVIGSEPEIYFYAHRHAATGYLYTYPLVEPQKYAAVMQRDMIQQITANHPKYMVMIKRIDSWMIHEGSPDLIFIWSEAYLRANYSIVGLVDWVPNQPDSVEFHWDADAQGRLPRSVYYIQIMKRNDQSGEQQ